jgi:hypothetical protein
MLRLCYEMAQLMEAALAVADDCSLCWPRHHTVSGFLALSIELIRAIIYFFPLEYTRRVAYISLY